MRNRYQKAFEINMLTYRYYMRMLHLETLGDRTYVAVLRKIHDGLPLTRRI